MKYVWVSMIACSVSVRDTTRRLNFLWSVTFSGWSRACTPLVSWLDQFELNFSTDNTTGFPWLEKTAVSIGHHRTRYGCVHSTLPFHKIKNSQCSHCLIPRPHPHGGKGSGIHRAISGAYIWLYHTNQIHAIWFTCDYHVIIMWHHAIAVYCIHESGRCIAIPKWCIVMPITCHMTCCILYTLKTTQCVPYPFPLWGWGLRMRLYTPNGERVYIMQLPEVGVRGGWEVNNMQKV